MSLNILSRKWEFPFNFEKLVTGETSSVYGSRLMQNQGTGAKSLKSFS